MGNSDLSHISKLKDAEFKEFYEICDYSKSTLCQNKLFKPLVNL